ncbi:sigma-70 family RNA polymerase sigma factor [Primorskyibacter sp. 2E233]|uniref:sigma-70 family RNA polymerase sigma factor n=1 Tax=Primorskyibacter sp. 2E233 TaxID=3413431 RepID=UPI003BF06C78
MDKETMNRLRARAARLGHSGPAGEDLAQEAVLGYLERLKAGGAITAPLPYMMTSLRHAAHLAHRYHANQAPLEEAPEPIVPDAETTCLFHEVEKAITSLPEADRALLSHVVAGTTRPSELAALYGVPEGTINSRLARARQKLRRVLGET